MEEGDIDSAKEQRGMANQARQAAHQYEQAEYQESQQRFAQAWRTNAEAVIKEVPELGDPESEASQAMVALLEREPLLAQLQDGFRKGYEILKTQKEAAEASGLRDENTKLKKENERLNKLLNPLGSKGSPSHSGPTKFSEMSLDEQRAHLSKQAELQDAA
jgi:hypothetical protein